MTSILGTLANSTGDTLGGTLTFTLTQPYVDDSTVPDTVRLPIIKSFTIIAGAVSLTVPESETLGIPYKVEFTPTGATEPLLNFYAIVPNVATVQFASLVPTGLTNASVDTGALRVARLILNDPTLAPLARRSNLLNINLEARSTLIKLVQPKTYLQGTLVQRMVALLTSGTEANWAIQAGYINSSGADVPLTPASTVANTVSGRRVVAIEYGISVPSNALGLYLGLNPTGGATALTGTASLAYVETSL